MKNLKKMLILKINNFYIDLTQKSSIFYFNYKNIVLITFYVHRYLVITQKKIEYRLIFIQPFL